MEGGWHVAADGSSWWNGVMWVPGQPPGSANPDGDTTSTDSPIAPLVVFLVGLAIMAAIIFIAWQAFQAMTPLTPPPGF